jgi:hypothetical protein
VRQRQQNALEAHRGGWSGQSGQRWMEQEVHKCQRQSEQSELTRDR